MRAIKNTAENPTYMSEQDYLEGEKLAEIRHEYVDGVVYAMALGHVTWLILVHMWATWFG